MIQDLFSFYGIGVGNMISNHLFQFFHIIFIFQLLDSYQFFIYFTVDITVFIQHVSYTTAHAGCKVLANLTDDSHTSSGHVFTSVIAHAFDNCGRSRVTNTETFTSQTVDISFSTGGTVESYVTDDDILILFISNTLWWINDQFSSGKTFSEVVIGISYQFQGQSLWNEGSKALSAGTVTLHGEGIFFQCIVISSCNLRTEDRTKCTVGVGHIHFNASLLFLIQSRFQLLHQDTLISCLFQMEIIDMFRIKDTFFSQIWVVQNRT